MYYICITVYRNIYYRILYNVHCTISGMDPRGGCYVSGMHTPTRGCYENGMHTPTRVQNDILYKGNSTVTYGTKFVFFQLCARALTTCYQINFGYNAQSPP